MANSLTSTELTLGSSSATSIVRWGGSSILGCGYNITVNNTSTYTDVIVDRDGRIPNMSVGEFFSGYYGLRASSGYSQNCARLLLPSNGSYAVLRYPYWNSVNDRVLESVQYGPVLYPFRVPEQAVQYFTEKFAGSTMIASAVSSPDEDSRTYNENRCWVRVAILRMS